MGQETQEFISGAPPRNIQGKDIRSMKMSSIVYLHTANQEILLLKKNRGFHRGLWTVPGGKLRTEEGESPHEAALREIREETGVCLQSRDIHLFGIVNQRNYPDGNHWLMFLFTCPHPQKSTLQHCGEGHLRYFSRAAITDLAVPAMDRKYLWPLYWSARHTFTAISIDCSREPVSL